MTPEKIIAKTAWNNSPIEEGAAKRVVEALDAAEYVIVPKEPTEAMAEFAAVGYFGMAHTTAADIYRRMLLWVSDIAQNEESPPTG